MMRPLLALLIGVSTTVSAYAYEPGSFPGKGSSQQYKKAWVFAADAIKLSEREKYKEALPIFQKAIAIYPFDAGVRCEHGTALAGLGKHAEAIQEFKAASNLEPSYTLPINNLADELKILKDYKAAESVCRKAIGLEPNNPVPLVTLAEVFIETKDYVEAKRLLSKAFRLASQSSDKQEVMKVINADLAKIVGSAK